MPIQILSDQTINKIAAGEVIENPASVVKELVENALDAKSTTIRVEIQDGGFSLIRVSDDGEGMKRDDLLLSLERHATSKIQEADDLMTIATMGFRGEALASIASISKVRIKTATGIDPLGGEAIIEGGKVRGIHPAARQKGTTVEVSSLFYNVPARRKFQKSQGASLRDITKFLTKFALACPTVHIRYVVDGKEVIHALPGDAKGRVADLLGGSFLKGSFSIDISKQGCHLKGFVGSPMQAKANRLGQHLFVNGRAVVCPQITRAIYQGYGTRLGSRDHPMFVLHLTLPPEWVDVNVHPQKREIRLREEKEVEQLVHKGVMEAFQEKGAPKVYPKGSWDFQAPLKFQEKKEPPLPTLNFQEGAQEEVLVIGLFDHFLIIHPPSFCTLPNKPGPYEGIFLIDLKGAIARILYERFLKEETPPMQTLMIPITLTFPPHETKVLESHTEEILGMGIDLRPFGEGTFIIDALSPEIEEGKLQALLEEFVEALDQNLAVREKEKKLAFTLSSYARSQKRGWTILEAKETVKQLMKAESPYDCPQGKPTMIHLDHDALTHLFQKATH